jgi:hypothetical protein
MVNSPSVPVGKNPAESRRCLRHLLHSGMTYVIPSWPKQEFFAKVRVRMDPELLGKTGVFPCSGIPQPVLEKILCPIIAICFRVFTSEKPGENGNYARFLANYARFPWRDCASGPLPGSRYRRRSGDGHLSKGHPLSQVDGRPPQETMVSNTPAAETICMRFFYGLYVFALKVPGRRTGKKRVFRYSFPAPA